jgi:hypothetical protein
MILNILLIVEFISLFVIIFVILKLSNDIYIKNGGQDVFSIKKGE